MNPREAYNDIFIDLLVLVRLVCRLNARLIFDSRLEKSIDNILYTVTLVDTRSINLRCPCPFCPTRLKTFVPRLVVNESSNDIVFLLLVAITLASFSFRQRVLERSNKDSTTSSRNSLSNEEEDSLLSVTILPDIAFSLARNQRFLERLVAAAERKIPLPTPANLFQPLLREEERNVSFVRVHR